MKMLHL